MSLKGDKYETADEIRARIESSVVLYNGKPVYISQVQGAGVDDAKEIARVIIHDLPLVAGVVGTRKYLSSKHFDLAPFKMGYVNERGEATFIARTPVRQYRQGLNTGVTTFTNVKGQKSEILNFDRLLKCQGFVDMVSGKYPSFKEAGDVLGDKGVTSIAVSRMFAFLIDHDLEALVMLHKGVKCGLSMRGDKAMKVPDKFRFLREEMEDCRIPIA